MFGPVEHEIAKEIAKIVNGGRNDVIDDSMEPIDWDRLAHIRQPEIIATVANANDPGRKPIQMLLWQAGTMLVAAGQKMMQAANRVLEGQSATAQVSSEDC